MKFLNNGGEKVPTGCLLFPKKASSTSTGLHSIVLLAKGVPWKSPNKIGYSPQTDKAPLLKSISIQVIEHRDVKLTPTQNLQPMF